MKFEKYMKIYCVQADETNIDYRFTTRRVYSWTVRFDGKVEAGRSWKRLPTTRMYSS